jgi:two-component system chemotaxis response regulator CheY
MTESPAKGRVLVIDDSTMARRYVRNALERAAFAVEEAFNGLEAMEKILARPFDLLIVDVNMPKMDGLSFLRALRGRDDAFASIPALMTSTEAQERDFEAARAAGANCYLVKPVAQDDLVRYSTALTGRAP